MKSIFHEVHITVEHQESFEKDCIELGVKPIIIEMATSIPTHSMTSSTYENKSDAEVYTETLNLKNKLENLGYEVQRLKIETVPWHPQASSPSKEQYFEAHFLIEGYISKEDLKKYNLHRSRNFLKKTIGSFQMLTFRENSKNSLEFNFTIDNLISNLEKLDFKTIKTIREFAIYDSNLSLDDQWLSL